MNEKTHVLRNFVLGVVLIVLALTFIPDLGAHHTARTSLPHESSSLDDIDRGLDELQTWTVFLHRGYNPEFGCWVLRLNKGSNGYDPREITSDFCAKDQADYDAHPVGSQYQTKGGWLDNLLHAPGPSDGA
jgi:hypothetical protein